MKCVTLPIREHTILALAQSHYVHFITSIACGKWGNANVNRAKAINSGAVHVSVNSAFVRRDDGCRGIPPPLPA